MSPEDLARQTAHKAREDALLALANNADFTHHFLNGYLADLEAQYLTDLSTCPTAELEVRRQRWLDMQNLRKTFTSDVAAITHRRQESTDSPHTAASPS